MPVTRINNNQISDSSAGNLYLGIDAATKVQDYSVTSGKIANNLVYGSDLTVSGNLTVNGNTTTIDTVNVVIEDPLILLADAQTGSPTLDIGFIGKRGTEENITFIWDESADKFVAAFTTSEITNTTVSITSYASLMAGNLSTTAGGNLTVDGPTTLTGNATVGNFFVDGQKTVDVGNNRIGNAAEPVANSDVATKAYVDSQSASGFTIEDDLANTTVVSGGDTLQLLGTTNEVTVEITNVDQITFGLPDDVVVTGNLDAANVNATTNVTGTTFTATGNVNANNAVITNGINSSTVTASGNITGSNINATASVVATGNISGNNAIITNLVQGTTVTATGNVNGGNVISSALVQGVTVTASGNLNGNNAVITNDVSTTTLSASGNVLAGNVNSNAAVTGVTGIFSGNVNMGNATATGNINAGNLISSGAVIGNIEITGNIDVVNVNASGNLNGNNAVITNNISTATLSASGNVLAGNVNSNAAVTGVTGTFTGNVDANNMISTNLVQGTTVTATGNVNGGNVISTALVQGATVTATGNLNGNNAVITNDVSAATGTFTGNVLAGNLNSNAAVTGVTGTFTGNVGAGNVISTNLVQGTTVTATGNLNGNNAIVTNLVQGTTVTAIGNLNGNNAVITNDVSAATGSFSGNVVAGNVNSNAAVTGVTGTFTGNVDAGNVISTNLVQGTTVTATGNLNGNNAVITNNVNATNLIATANVDGANLNATTAVYTPNVSGATLTLTTTSGNVFFDVAGGRIDMGGTEVHNVASPTDASDAATKEYVDNAVSTGITIHTPVYAESNTSLAATYAQGGTTATVTDTVAGNTVVFSTAVNPQVNDQYWFSNSFSGIAANTAYFVVSAPNTSAAVLSTTYNGLPVSNISNATGLTQSVRINSGVGATLTGNVSGALTVDGINPIAGQRILVYTQTVGYENGVYVVTDAGNISAPYILTRSNDTDTYGPEDINALDAGDYFFVQAGNTAAGESYVMTAPIGPFVIGYTSLTFTQFSASSTYSANTSAGLVLNGTIFSAKVDNDTTAFGVGGNIIVKAGANLVTPNIGDATGNSLTLNGNGLLSATTVTATGNISGNNVNSTNSVTGVTGAFTGNVSGNNVTSTNLVQGTTVTATGNVNGGNVISLALVSGTTVTASGNLNGNNAVITNDVSTTTVSASGNVLAGNVNSNAAVTGVTGTFSGNISGNNITSTNLVQGTTLTATGNVNGGNVISTALVQGATVTATGNLNGNNAVITNDVSTTTLTASGNILAGNVNSNAAVTGVTGTFTGNVDANNITSTNLVQGTTVTATGNVNGGNVISSALVSGVTVTATGNLNGNNAVITNDVSTTTLTASGNVLAGNVNSNAAVTGVTGTFTGNVDANNMISTNLVQGTTVTATGNVNGGNVISTALVQGVTVTATGNLNGNNAIVTNLVQGTTLTATGNVNGNNIISTNLVQGTTVTATGNLNGNNATITGNVSAGNLEALSGNVSASGGYFTGNVSAQYFIGNVLGNISGNIDAGGANTEIQFNDNDNLNGSAAFTFDKTSNLVTASGNIQAGNLIATINVEGATLTASGNINAGNAVVTNDVGAATGTFSTSVSGGNITVSGDSIDGSNGLVEINGADADVNFAVNGDTVPNVFFVDAGTGTASFGNSTQTTGAVVAFNTANSILIPVGNTTQRPTGATGMIRFNTTIGQLEVFDGVQWGAAGSEITTIVVDSFMGDGSTTTFTLSQDSTTAGTIVTINGVVQIPTTAYAVTGNSLQFTEAPEVSDAIDARILTTTYQITGISNAPGNAKVEVVDTSSEIQITGSLVPTANVTYDLGSSTNWWNNGYFSGSTIYLGGLQMKASGNTFAVYTADGVTQANIDAGSIDVSSISSGTSEIGISGVNGNAYITVGGVANVLVASTTGVTVSGNVTAQDVNSLSDAVLKINIQPLSGVDSVISRLSGVEYDWKNGSGHSYGFLAQEVEKVLPSAVKTGADGLKSINYMMIIPFLVETIKQMGDEIKDLKQTVQKRRGKK